MSLASCRAENNHKIHKIDYSMCLLTNDTILVTLFHWAVKLIDVKKTNYKQESIACCIHYNHNLKVLSLLYLQGTMNVHRNVLD